MRKRRPCSRSSSIHRRALPQTERSVRQMKDILNRTEEIVKKTKKLGADQVIAKTTIGRYRQVRFSNNQVDITLAWNDYVTEVVLAWKKRVVATLMHYFVNIDASL